MASSSKSINMPLMFAVTIGATVSLVASVMFALAWYEYEAKVVLREQVIETPTHSPAYNDRLAEQEANLGDIDKAMAAVAEAQGHGAHGDAGHGTAPHGDAAGGGHEGR